MDGFVTALQYTGGISVYFGELIVRLARDGRPFVLDVYGDTPLANAAPAGALRRFRPRRFERLRRAPEMPGATLFHSSYYRLPSGKVPAVTTIHDFIWERVIKGPRAVPHRIIKTRAILGSEAIICVSEATRRDLLELIPRCDPTRVHVVHNGVSDGFFPLNMKPSMGKKPYVLYIGSRANYKNFDLAVHAVARLGGHDLIAVGGGAFSTAERELAARLLPARVQHFGYLSEEDLNRLYNGAAFFLYPSSYEGFGLPVIEAMRAGCPVVAVATSSIPEVAGDAASLAEAPDVDALTAAIQKAIDAGTRAEMISRGLKNAERFSWERTYRETMGVYSLLSNRSL